MQQETKVEPLAKKTYAAGNKSRKHVEEQNITAIPLITKHLV